MNNMDEFIFLKTCVDKGIIFRAINHMYYETIHINISRKTLCFCCVYPGKIFIYRGMNRVFKEHFIERYRESHRELVRIMIFNFDEFA